MRKIIEQFTKIIFFLLVFVPTTVFAMPPIMTTAQLHAGMIGTAKTVVQGDKIESFNVEIIGVEDNGGGAPKQIMARAYGPMMNDTNGVIHGMSGSPVYVDGYLIGAVARGIGSDTNPHIFFITPIEDMMKLWNFPDEKNKGKINQVKINTNSHEQQLAEDEKHLETILKKVGSNDKKNVNSKTSSTVNTDNSSQVVLSKAAKTDTAKVTFVNTANWEKKYGAEADSLDKPKNPIALYVSGFSDTAREFLSEKLEPFNMQPYSLNLMTNGGEQDSLVKSDYTLNAGSSVGVAIAYGDFSVGAVGTVTAIDNNKILAFGHPFTYRGNVNYFMTDADIVGTASGVVNGQKVSSMGHIIGRINQDRYSGVSGIVGQYPQVVPVKVTVDDKDLNRHRVYGSNIAYDEELLPNLAASISYAALDRTIDSLSAGTANIKFKIMTNAVSSGEIDRSNMYYNSANVGQFTVSELGQLLSIICSDEHKNYDITGISVDMSFDNERKTASILNVIPDKLIVHPGEVVNLKIILQPYRAAKEQLLVPYTVPKQQTGDLVLEIRGGGLVPVAALAMKGIDLSPEEDKSVTAETKIQDFLQTDKNNEIIIDRAVKQITNDAEQKKAVENAIKMQNKMEQNGQMNSVSAVAPKQKISTKYIIDNVVRIKLKVKD